MIYSCEELCICNFFPTMNFKNKFKLKLTFYLSFCWFFPLCVCLAGIFVLSHGLPGVPVCGGTAALQQRSGILCLLPAGCPHWWDMGQDGTKETGQTQYTLMLWCLQVMTCMTPHWQTGTAGFVWLWTQVWTGWWRETSCSQGRSYATPPSPPQWPLSSQNAPGPLERETGERQVDFVTVMQSVRCFTFVLLQLQTAECGGHRWSCRWWWRWRRCSQDGGWRVGLSALVWFIRIWR